MFLPPFITNPFKLGFFPQKIEVRSLYRIHGTGIFPYMNCRICMVNVGKYTIVPWIIWVLAQRFEHEKLVHLVRNLLKFTMKHHSQKLFDVIIKLSNSLFKSLKYILIVHYFNNILFYHIFPTASFQRLPNHQPSTPLSPEMNVLLHTWRIIPDSKWLITMVIVSPLRVGLWDPFQMAMKIAYQWGNPNHLQVLGAHPPSIPQKITIHPFTYFR